MMQDVYGVIRRTVLARGCAPLHPAFGSSAIGLETGRARMADQDIVPTQAAVQLG